MQPLDRQMIGEDIDQEVAGGPKQLLCSDGGRHRAKRSKYRSQHPCHALVAACVRKLGRTVTCNGHSSTTKPSPTPTPTAQKEEQPHTSTHEHGKPREAQTNHWCENCRRPRSRPMLQVVSGKVATCRSTCATWSVEVRGQDIDSVPSRLIRPPKRALLAR